MGITIPETHCWFSPEGDGVSTKYFSPLFYQFNDYICGSYVRSLLLLRAGSNAFAMSLPVLASVLSFVTYSLSGTQLSTVLDRIRVLKYPPFFDRA
jgi:hypothetical protein